jgi:hypothetical protein
MEKVINAAIDGITSKNSGSDSLFKTEEGRQLTFPKKLRKLGYTNNSSTEINAMLTVEELWSKVRNPIAHHNRKPTFQETYDSLCILVKFVQDMPATLMIFSIPEK